MASSASSPRQAPTAQPAPPTISLPPSSSSSWSRPASSPGSPVSSVTDLDGAKSRAESVQGSVVGSEDAAVNLIGEELVEALKSAKDRMFVIKTGEEMERFVKDGERTKLDISPINSYQKMIIHRCAAYYRLLPETEPNKMLVTLYKAHSTVLPALRLGEAVPHEGDLPTRSFKIMRRSNLDRSQSSTPRSRDGSSDGGGKARSAMTIEEREAAYQEARNRIFMDFPAEKEKQAAEAAATVAASSSAVELAPERVPVEAVVQAEEETFGVDDIPRDLSRLPQYGRGRTTPGAVYEPQYPAAGPAVLYQSYGYLPAGPSSQLAGPPYYGYQSSPSATAPPFVPASAQLVYAPSSPSVPQQAYVQAASAQVYQQQQAYAPQQPPYSAPTPYSYAPPSQGVYVAPTQPTFAYIPATAGAAPPPQTSPFPSHARASAPPQMQHSPYPGPPQQPFPTHAQQQRVPSHQRPVDPNYPPSPMSARATAYKISPTISRNGSYHDSYRAASEPSRPGSRASSHGSVAPPPLIGMRGNAIPQRPVELGKLDSETRWSYGSASSSHSSRRHRCFGSVSSSRSSEVGTNREETASVASDVSSVTSCNVTPPGAGQHPLPQRPDWAIGMRPSPPDIPHVPQPRRLSSGGPVHDLRDFPPLAGHRPLAATGAWAAHSHAAAGRWDPDSRPPPKSGGSLFDPKQPPIGRSRSSSNASSARSQSVASTAGAASGGAPPPPSGFGFVPVTGETDQVIDGLAALRLGENTLPGPEGRPVQLPPLRYAEVVRR